MFDFGSTIGRLALRLLTLGANLNTWIMSIPDSFNDSMKTKRQTCATSCARSTSARTRCEADSAAV
jgi:hypothetical protein